MLKYKITFVSFFLVFAFFVSCKNNDKNQKKENPPVSVDVIIAGEDDLLSEIEVNGTVLSEEMIELHPEVSGRLTYLNVPDGATVKEGTILAKINDADLQAELKKLTAQLDLANKTEERLEKLLEISGVNQSNYDAALNEVNTLEASIKAKEAQIEKTIIKASFTGKLGLRLVSLGAYVTPTTVISTLQTDKVKIDFAVPEAYKDLINVGEKVIIQTTLSNINYTATISAFEPKINAETRNLKVRARLDSGILSSGAFVKVQLLKKSKGIMVPTNAIIPDDKSNQLIVVKNGKGKYTSVETGTRTSDFVDITKGLTVGDSIVVSGVLFVRPNSKVKVSKVKKLSDLAE